MKTKVRPKWFKNSKGLCGLAPDPDRHLRHCTEKRHSEQGTFYTTSGTPSPQSWEPPALLIMLSHVLRWVISKPSVATFCSLVSLRQLIPPHHHLLFWLWSMGASTQHFLLFLACPQLSYPNLLLVCQYPWKQSSHTFGNHYQALSRLQWLFGKPLGEPSQPLGNLLAKGLVTE